MVPLGAHPLSRPLSSNSSFLLAPTQFVPFGFLILAHWLPIILHLLFLDYRPTISPYGLVHRATFLSLLFVPASQLELLLKLPCDLLVLGFCSLLKVVTEQKRSLEEGLPNHAEEDTSPLS